MKYKFDKKVSFEKTVEHLVKFQMSTQNNQNAAQILSTCCKFAFLAGKEIKNVVGKDIELIDKSPDGINETDPQTIADRTAQQVILAGLRNAFSKSTFIAEEEEEAPGDLLPTLSQKDIVIEFSQTIQSALQSVEFETSDLTFWIDPMDGTRSFVEKNYHECSVLIGITVNSRPVAGIIHQPFDGVTTLGLIGVGAFQGLHNPDGSIKWTTKLTPPVTQNGRMRLITPSKPSCRRDLAVWAFEKTECTYAWATGIMLLQVAMGKQDLFLRLRPGTMRWDICACEAILLSMGGVLVDSFGQEYHYGSEFLNSTGVIATLDRSLLTPVLRNIQDLSLLSQPDGSYSKTWLMEKCQSHSERKISRIFLRPESVGRGRHSFCARVCILYQDDSEEELFLKRSLGTELPERSEEKWERDLRSYRNESNFYTFIYPTLDVPGVKPRFIFQEPALQQYVLMLECIDNSYEQHNSLDLKCTRAALQYAAKLHAVGWTKRKTWPQDIIWATGGWWDYPKRGEEELNQARDIWTRFKKQFQSYQVDQYFEQPEIATLDERMIQNAQYISQQLEIGAQDNKTLIHGDFKCGNLFFQQQSKEAIAIDWQWTGYGLPAKDVAYLLTTSVDLQVIQEHEQDLLQYYYDQLKLQNPLTVASYPFHAFLRHYQLGVLEYGRVAISYFWDKTTPESCKRLENERNRGLVYRSVPHALYLVEKMNQLLKIVEQERC